MTVRSLSALVVATGDGAPMRSARPKPIHMLCGRPMASYVLRSLGAAGVSDAVVVTNPDGGRVSKRLLEDAPSYRLRFVEHPAGLGTADAVLAGVSALDLFEDDADLVVLPADLPLIRPGTIERLLEKHRSSGAACTLLTASSDVVDPVLDRQRALSGSQSGTSATTSAVSRDRRGRVVAVLPREQVEADEAAAAAADAANQVGELAGSRVDRDPDTVRLSRRNRDAIRRAMESDAEPVSAPIELSLGILCIRSGLLAPALRRLNPNRFPASRRFREPVVEQSVTVSDPAAPVSFEDVISVLAASGHPCETAAVADAEDLIAVDSRLQMAEAEAELRRRTNRFWLERGVSMVDPERTYLDATVELGMDVTLFPGTILQGNTVIGDACEIGPDVHMDGCRVGEGSRVATTTAARATVGRDCIVGPFAALAPGCEIGDGTATGPFYAGESTE